MTSPVTTAPSSFYRQKTQMEWFLCRVLTAQRASSAPISLRRKAFEALAHSCLKIKYCKSSRHTDRVSWAIHFHPQGWPNWANKIDN
jgi:hypothetical protein